MATTRVHNTKWRTHESRGNQKKWRLQGTESANLGTWTHYLIELFLNRETINYHSKELKLFLKFLASLNHCVSYRTEWRVFAEDLKLAGSIDFVAKAEDETMIIIDWKLSLIHI